MKQISFKKKKLIPKTFRSEIAFEGTVVNRALTSLHGGLLAITLTFSNVFLSLTIHFNFEQNYQIFVMLS